MFPLWRLDSVPYDDVVFHHHDGRLSSHATRLGPQERVRSALAFVFVESGAATFHSVWACGCCMMAAMIRVNGGDVCVSLTLCCSPTS